MSHQQSNNITTYDENSVIPEALKTKMLQAYNEAISALKKKVALTFILFLKPS